MAKPPKNKNSLPHGNQGSSKSGTKAGAVQGGSGCNLCGGWSGPGPGIPICVPIGGGAFVSTFVPPPNVQGRLVMCIEGGEVFWGPPPAPEPEPPIGPQAGNDPDKEPPWRTVKRVSRRPKKRGKGKK